MNFIFNRQQKKTRAQAMIEFMLTLPLLIALIYGTIEVARLIFIFSSVANASRQAARYGSAAGEAGGGGFYYQDCDGIREVANESAFIIDFDEIRITYDRGVTSAGAQIPIGDIDPSPDVDTCPVEENIIRNGDRIIVQVSATYEPIIPILPIEPLEVVSASARTFLISVPIVGSALPFSFAAESPTPSKIPTLTSSADRPTVAPFFTSTRAAPSGGTPFGGVNPTSIAPPALTFTPSRTPLATSTPSITPTAISCTGLTGVWHGPLTISDNVMEMEIVNGTGHVLSVSQVYVEWNHDTGHQSGNDRTVRLRQVIFASQAWNGDILSPSAYIPAYYPSIPTGASKIQFRFHQNYLLTDGTERIIITIGTPGCVGYPVDSRN